jgi:hypothetical protein
MPTRRIGVVVLMAVAIVGGARIAAAQPSPTAAPHPNMPWNYYNPAGQVVRYIQVPAQQVEIDGPASAPAPEAASDSDKQSDEQKPPPAPTAQKQVVEIPGYTVTETTAGFIYPERWTLQPTGGGGYQWVRLPQEFRRK